MYATLPETYQTQADNSSEKPLKTRLLDALTLTYKFDFEEGQGCFPFKKRYWIGKIDEIYLVPEKLGYPNNEFALQGQKRGIFGCWYNIVLVINNTQSTIDALCDIQNTTQLTFVSSNDEACRPFKPDGYIYYCKTYKVKRG